VISDSIADVLADNEAAPTEFPALDFAPDLTVRGFAFDGQYHVLLESNAAAGSGSEVFVVTYNSMADVFADNKTAPAGFSALDLAPDSSVGGFAFDGSHYNKAAPTGSPGLDLAPDFSAGGLAFDGKYHVLPESDADTGSGSEVFVATYNAIGDLLADSKAPPTGFSALGLAPDFGLPGFATEFTARAPEPETLLLLGMGTIALGWARRRKS
jgi:hypothetical protein